MGFEANPSQELVGKISNFLLIDLAKESGFLSELLPEANLVLTAESEAGAITDGLKKLFPQSVNVEETKDQTPGVDFYLNFFDRVANGSEQADEKTIGIAIAAFSNIIHQNEGEWLSKEGNAQKAKDAINPFCSFMKDVGALTTATTALSRINQHEKKAEFLKDFDQENHKQSLGLLTEIGQKIFTADEATNANSIYAFSTAIHKHTDSRNPTGRDGRQSLRQSEGYQETLKNLFTQNQNTTNSSIKSSLITCAVLGWNGKKNPQILEQSSKWFKEASATDNIKDSRFVISTFASLVNHVSANEKGLSSTVKTPEIANALATSFKKAIGSDIQQGAFFAIMFNAISVQEQKDIKGLYSKDFVNEMIASTSRVTENHDQSYFSEGIKKFFETQDGQDFLKSNEDLRDQLQTAVLGWSDENTCPQKAKNYAAALEVLNRGREREFVREVAPVPQLQAEEKKQEDDLAGAIPSPNPHARPELKVQQQESSFVQTYAPNHSKEEDKDLVVDSQSTKEVTPDPNSSKENQGTNYARTIAASLEAKQRMSPDEIKAAREEHLPKSYKGSEIKGNENSFGATPLAPQQQQFIVGSTM